MFAWLKRRTAQRRKGQQIYERIVAQAREPALYRYCGVPDTMDGRLEMVLLHTVLVLERLQLEGPVGQRLGQNVMEYLVADVDDALRQIGLGDDSVTARIKKLAGAIAERSHDYRLALRKPPVEAGSKSAGGSKTATLEATLVEHVYRSSTETPSSEIASAASRLAAYARHARTTLTATPSSRVLAGEPGFPALADPSGDRPEMRA